MIDIFRIIQDQSVSYSSEATGNSAGLAKQLEILFQRSTEAVRKQYVGWHKLIRSPFQYPLPVKTLYQARFRPPQSLKNVFYGSVEEETAFYEFAYHYVKERFHLVSGDTCDRTSFSVELNNKTEFKIHNNPKVAFIMDPFSYSGSHNFVNSNPNYTVICYPSCRDPIKRDSYAVLDINMLAKNQKSNRNITIIWDASLKELTCIDLNIKLPYTSHQFSPAKPALKKKRRVSSTLIKKKPRKKVELKSPIGNRKVTRKK